MRNKFGVSEIKKKKKKIGEAMEVKMLFKDFNRVPPQKNLVENQITKAEERSSEEELTEPNKESPWKWWQAKTIRKPRNNGFH